MEMSYKLTAKYQHSKKQSDGKRRNYVLYFLNGVEIHKTRVPYDTDYEIGFQNRTHSKNTYLLNGNLYETRFKLHDKKERDVRYPISKKKLIEFDIPKDLKIDLCGEN